MPGILSRLFALQEAKAKELHYELVPFLCNNTTIFIKVRLSTRLFWMHWSSTRPSWTCHFVAVLHGDAADSPCWPLSAVQQLTASLALLRSASHISNQRSVDYAGLVFQSRAEPPATVPMQELWSMLHSASNNATGIPDQLQQEEIERLKQREAQAAALQVTLLAAIFVHSVLMPGCLSAGHTSSFCNADTTLTLSRLLPTAPAVLPRGIYTPGALQTHPCLCGAYMPLFLSRVRLIPSYNQRVVENAFYMAFHTHCLTLHVTERHARTITSPCTCS